jgi:hypothetical protein
MFADAPVLRPSNRFGVIVGVTDTDAPVDQDAVHEDDTELEGEALIVTVTEVVRVMDIDTAGEAVWALQLAMVTMQIIERVSHDGRR